MATLHHACSCGKDLQAQSEHMLVRMSREHAKKQHNTDLTPAAVLKVIRQNNPRGGGP